MLAREQARCIPRSVFHPSAWEVFLRSSRQAESGGIMLAGGKVDSLGRCSERREVSEEDENRAVVRRWIETFNNPYTPQTEVDVLAPGYIAHAPGLPGPLDLEAWSQFTASFVEAFPDLRLTVEDKVTEHWFEMDLLGLMQQLGAIPEPEQSGEASAT